MSQGQKQRSITEYTRTESDVSRDLSDVKCPVCGRLLESIDMVNRVQHVEECLSISFIQNEQVLNTGSTIVRTESPNRLLVKSSLSLNDLTLEVTKKRKQKIESPKKEKQRYVNNQSNIKKRKRKITNDVITKTESNEGTTIKTEAKEETAYDPIIKTEPDLPSKHPSIPLADLTAQSVFKAKPSIKSEPVESNVSQPLPAPPKYRRPPIPELKTLTFPITPSDSYQISVDAFSFKPHDTIDKYFLTHFHADHYGGISKKWCTEGTELCQRTIYCTTITSKLLQIRFNIDPIYIQAMEMDKRYLIKSFVDDKQDELIESENTHPGLYVFLMTANHCPGAAIFLFESIALDGSQCFMLHCGDFRVNKKMLLHPRLLPFLNTSLGRKILDKVYLDTTYMSRTHNFPKQEVVCDTVADLFYILAYEDTLFNKWFGSLQSRITDFLTNNKGKKKRLLILIGTYVIGKERIAIAILKRLKNCPIFISNIRSRGDKAEILSSFQDDYLDLIITDNELGNAECNAVIHLVPMEIVSSINETSAYFNHNQYFNHFERCIGLRPSGWTFVATKEEKQDESQGFQDTNKELSAIINTLKNDVSFNYTEDILKQNPLPNAAVKSRKPNDNSLYKVYGLPYSEHSSYRELSFFVIFLNIREVIPTVNTHNEWSVLKMNNIISLWTTLKNVKFYGSTIPMDSELLNSIRNLSLDDF